MSSQVKVFAKLKSLSSLFMDAVLPLGKSPHKGSLRRALGLSNFSSTSPFDKAQAHTAPCIDDHEFRLLAEAMPQIVWITDADGRNIYFNQRWVDYTGLSLEESAGHGWNTPFHLDDQKLAWDAWQSAVFHLATYSLECRIRCHDGTYQWWLVRGVPRFDAKGHIVHWYGTCTNIEDIKSTEAKLQVSNEELRKMVNRLATTQNELLRAYNEVELKIQERTLELAKSEKRHRLIIETMLQGAIVHARDGSILSINPAACDILGLNSTDPEELASGDQWGHFFREDGAPLRPEEHPTKLALETSSLTGPIVLGYTHRKSGERRWISISAVPIHRHDESVIDEVYTVFEDITERQLAKISIIATRTAAQNLAQSKTDFLANMSHEIRTPMNGIIGLTQLALHDAPCLKVQTYLQKIALCSQSLLGILNDILDLSKHEAGHLRIEQAPLSLQDLLDHLYIMFEDQARSKGLEFSVSLDALASRHAIGDSLRLQQVLSNLIGNALKFTEQGSVLVWITSQIQNPTQSLFTFCVEDSGIGIAEADMDKLFKVFSQVDGTITRRFGGSGLGLALSQKLVELMGGKFHVKSTLHKGSEFSFDLLMDHAPLSDVSDAQDFVSPISYFADIGIEKRHDLQGKHILVAEDDAVSQMVIQGYLALMSIKVTLVQNGLEVLRALEDQTFDAILMDVHMPLMSGSLAAQIIRKQDAQARMPIIALTAGLTHEEQSECLDSGMDDILAKPVDPGRLHALLLHWLKDARTAI